MTATLRRLGFMSIQDHSFGDLHRVRHTTFIVSVTRPSSCPSHDVDLVHEHIPTSTRQSRQMLTGTNHQEGGG